jgi:hypothetical protein
MKEQEFKEICSLISKTENCLDILKTRLDDYTLEKQDMYVSCETTQKDFREQTFRVRKKIDWNIVRARRAYRYSWRKIAGEIGVSHTILIRRARRMGMSIE